MVGFERNQDVVKLCSYAPLFSHVHYQSWYPNLIMFDNSRSYVIPSYYCFKLFGANRGDMVVSSKESCEKIYLSLHGLPVINGDCGLTWKNAVFNSIPVFQQKACMEKPYRTMIHMFYRKMMPMNLLISQFEVKFYLALL